MTDKQRGGGEREGAEAAPASSVGAQQSNIAAKALIMSPDSAVPLPSILPLACELDPRGGGETEEEEASTASLHAAVGDRASKPLLSPLDGVCTKRPLEDSLDIQSPTSRRKGEEGRRVLEASRHPSIPTPQCLTDYSYSPLRSRDERGERDWRQSEQEEGERIRDALRGRERRHA